MFVSSFSTAWRDRGDETLWEGDARQSVSTAGKEVVQLQGVDKSIYLILLFLFFQPWSPDLPCCLLCRGVLAPYNIQGMAHPRLPYDVYPTYSLSHLSIPPCLGLPIAYADTMRTLHTQPLVHAPQLVDPYPICWEDRNMQGMLA